MVLTTGFHRCPCPVAHWKVLQKLCLSSLCRAMLELAPAHQMQGEAPNLQQKKKPSAVPRGALPLQEDQGAVVCLLLASCQDGPCTARASCASLLRPQAPRGGSLEEEEEEEQLEAPDGHADPWVPCLYPTGCSKMWDNITCWPATPRGQVVVLACPLIYNLISPLKGKSPGFERGSWGAHVARTRVESRLPGE